MTKIGVVGCGYWGPNLIRNFSFLPDCDMLLACDSKQSRIEHIKKIYPEVEVTTDFSDVVNNDEVDAVAISTPVRTHYDMARQCLLKGKHVLLEKPMTSSLKESRELVKLANEQDKVLMVDHTFEYTAAVNKIVEERLARDRKSREAAHKEEYTKLEGTYKQLDETDKVQENS